MEENKENKKTETIDEYIAEYPADLQAVMQDLREFIRKCAPEAAEKISWGMPTFYLQGNLVHFAMNKGYVGLYPGESGVSVFMDDLAGYTTTKGSIHLPLNKPLPYDLIKRIVEYRVDENKKITRERLEKKKNKKKQ